MSLNIFDYNNSAVSIERFTGNQASFTESAVSSLNLSEVAVCGVIDVETTGLDSSEDEIFEVALRLITYKRSNRSSVEVGPMFHWLQQPQKSIPAEVVKLTKVNIQSLKGKVIDWKKLEQLLASCEIVIAHNAKFDRAFIERKVNLPKTAVWACSSSQVPWESYGFTTRKLEFLCIQNGFYSGFHSATNDVDSLLRLLLTKVDDGHAIIEELISASARRFARLELIGSSFGIKDDLKRIGFKWEPGQKIWYKVVAEENLESYKELLKELKISEKQIALRVVHIELNDKFRDRGHSID